MRNSQKIGIGIFSAGLLFMIAKRLFSIKKKKIYTAPDGVLYKEGQTYRSSDNNWYKDGKKIKFNIPPSSHQQEVNHKFPDNTQNVREQIYSPEVPFHHRGTRHN